MTAFAVLCQLGEAYAIRPTLEEAEEALASAEWYLDGAATCGHSAAGGWLRKRLPLRVVPVDAAQVAELLEEGTPVLDREP